MAWIPEVDLGKVSLGRAVLLQESVQNYLQEIVDLREKIDKGGPLFASCSAKIEELDAVLEWLQGRRERR